MAQNVISTNNIVVANGGTGVTSTVAYSLQCGGTTTTASHQTISPVATGQVLVSGGTGALPAFSAYPQISGLGIGASPGSTAGLTFDGTNFMSAYSKGTWTPTYYGSSTTGTTTYSTQNGYYVQIGRLIFIGCYLVGSAATGTGDIRIGGLPFTAGGDSTAYPSATLQASGLNYGASLTYVNISVVQSFTYCHIIGNGSSQSASRVQIANAPFNLTFSATYST